MNAADEIALCLICLFACKLFPFFINHAFSLMGSGVGGGGSVILRTVSVQSVSLLS